MKVLVLGGTGAMGTHLVKLLNESNIETVVTTRSFREDENNIKYIQGNAQDIDFIQKILQSNWDVVVDFMVYTTISFKARFDLFLQSTNQYVFISTARVYAGTNESISENSQRLLDVSKDKDFLATDEYSLTKARQENILKESKYKNWTIIRPYITYSESRMQLGVLEKEDWLYRALQGRSIVFSEDLISKFTTMTFGLDVSKGIFSIIGKPEAYGQFYHITSNISNTWNEILNIYLDVLENHLGNRPKVFLQSSEDFFKHHSAKYQMIYDRMYNRKFDNKNISNNININEFVNVEQGLKKCLEEFIKAPKFQLINWRKEALKDKISKERTPLNVINGFKNKLRYLYYRFLIK